MTGSTRGANQIKIPARFHPPHSLLGLLIRRKIGDAYRAETIYLVAVVSIGAVLIAVILTSASLAGGRVPAGWIWIAALYVGLAVIGFRRRIHIDIAPREVLIRQGNQRRRIRVRDVERYEEVDALAYHRREARDPSVECFVNDHRHDLFRIETRGDVLVLGIPPADAKVLRATLQSEQAALPEPVLLAEV